MLSVIEVLKDPDKLQKPEKFTMKQIIIVRADLNMSIGKTAAQVAHASVNATIIAEREYSDWFNSWVREGYPKIVLRAKREKDLIKAYNKAIELGLPASLIKDFGLTELEPGTITAVAVGPGPVELVNKVGKRFRLL